MSNLKDYEGYILVMDSETATKWEFADGQTVEFSPGEKDSIPECSMLVVVTPCDWNVPKIINWTERKHDLDMQLILEQE